jgi:hypothetical protein
LWVRSAFIKQLAISESFRLETNVQRLDFPARCQFVTPRTLPPHYEARRG